MRKDKKKVAVALKYDTERDEAPKVIAKGVGEVAEKIIEKAQEEGVKSLENKELANDLIKLEINDQIPEELYTAVAEILNYVYKLDSQKGYENV